jgi:hypothetical protein
MRGGTQSHQSQDITQGNGSGTQSLESIPQEFHGKVLKKRNKRWERAEQGWYKSYSQPDYDQNKTLLQFAKQKKLWRKHWGRAAFTVEQRESKSPQGKMTHFIQMVQAHGSVQLSMGAAQIGGVVDIDTHFMLHLTADVETKPRAPTVASVREVFEMMEVQKEKRYGYVSPRMQMVALQDTFPA